MSTRFLPRTSRLHGLRRSPAGHRHSLALPWLGAAGLLYAIHLALLFLPPLPPYLKGSLWDYVTGYVAVALGWIALYRVGPWAGEAWGSRPWGRRITTVTGGAALLLFVGLALRALSPELFVRFSREEGAWEPLGLFLYGGTAILLFGAARDAVTGADRRFLSLFAWGYALVAAEEVDHFGIFGGLIGRIEGVYTGSVHDLVQLGAEGLLSPLVVAFLGAVAVGLGVALVRRGYLQPARLAGLVVSRSGLWLLGGVVFVSVALAGEAGYIDIGDPSAEELLELAGTLGLAAFGLDVVTRSLPQRVEVSERGPAGSAPTPLAPDRTPTRAGRRRSTSRR